MHMELFETRSSFVHRCHVLGNLLLYAARLHMLQRAKVQYTFFRLIWVVTGGDSVEQVRFGSIEQFGR